MKLCFATATWKSKVCGCAEPVSGQRAVAKVDEPSQYLSGMFHGRGKPLEQMTNREIISAIVGFAVVGGFLIITSIVSAWRSGFSEMFSFVWSATGAVFVTTILARCIPPAVMELRRRRKSGCKKTEM
jgi:hypothetical protein